MNGSWDMYLASPTDFAGVDNIITNSGKEREPGVKIIETHSLIFDYVLPVIIVN